MTAGSGKSASTTYRLDRAFFGFDTASLPDNVNVTDTVLKVYVNSKLNSDNDGDDWVTVLQGSQPSTSNLATADYDLAGTINSPVEGVDSVERKDISSVTTGQYLNLNLNGVGKSWVSKTGATKLALREGHDIIDSPVVVSSGQYNQLTLRSANYTGTASDPVLSVTYTITPPPVTTNYGYDSEGQRVSSTNGSLTTKYPSKFYNFDGATSQKHISLGDLSVATVKGSGAIASIFYNHADHLAGSSVLTNSSGSTEEVLDYFPYGTIRVDDKAESFEEQRKYIGQEWDGSTGLSYLNARYYNPATAKFLSQDPLFWELPKEYLLDPQQQNSYSYARNNPVIGSDPTGLLNIIIPGTGYGEGWNSGQDGGQFLSNVTQTFGGNSVVFASATLWTGDNTDQARQAAANNLKSFVDKYFERHSNDHTLNIVAHSHGGNVAALFSQIADRKIDNLVTLGTPIRSEYKFNEASIGSHYNVFSLVDFVQVLGGNNISKAVKVTDGFIDNPFINNMGKIFGQIGEIGTAGRIVHQKGVKNIDATALTMKAVPFVGPHSKLWTNSRVWKGLESIIKK
jgi:RHS repeat-associated protein